MVNGMNPFQEDTISKNKWYWLIRDGCDPVTVKPLRPFSGDMWVVRVSDDCVNTYESDMLVCDSSELEDLAKYHLCEICHVGFKIKSATIFGKYHTKSVGGSEVMFVCPKCLKILEDSDGKFIITGE